MKGFLAVCLAQAPLFSTSPLTRPIHLAISYDEEIGCVGVRPMLAALAKRQPKPLGCFVGEPTGMAVVTGHKGKVAYRMLLRGTPGHTSRAPHHVNALDYGARLAGEIAALADQLIRSERQDPAYDVTCTTVVATGMHAGTARNIVPERCELDWECRSLDKDDRAMVEARILGFARDVLEPAMRQRAADASITIEKTIDYPGLATDPSHPLVALAQELSGSRSLSKVGFGTEAGLFTWMADIPAVVIGPGSIAVAHQPDEYVEESQLALCGDFIARLAAHCGA